MKKLLVILVGSMALTACGGGGGGGSGPTPTQPAPIVQPTPQPAPTLSINPAVTNVAMEESAVATVNVPFEHTGNGTVSYSINPRTQFISGGVQEGVLTLTSSDIDSPSETVEVDVTVTAGDLTDTATITVNINNTSLESAFGDFQKDISHMSKVVSRNAIPNVAVRYLEQVKMLGAISAKDYAVQQTSTQDSITSLNKEFERFSDNMPNSHLGLSTEADFALTLDDYSALLNKYASRIQEHINYLNSHGDIGLPTLSTNVLVDGKLNPVYGNTDYGTFTNGTFTYTEQHALLDKLAPEAVSVCTTNVN